MVSRPIHAGAGDASPAVRPEGWSARLLLICALLALGQFALVTSTFMLTGLLGPLGTDFGVSMAAAGQVIGLFSLSYALSAPLLAVATARVARRPLLIAALAIFAAANLAGAAAMSFGFLLAGRVVAAAADGLYAATASAIAATLAPPRLRGRVLALVNTGVTLAFVAGVPLGTLIGQRFDWRGTFVMVAAIAAAAAIGLAAALPDVPTPRIASLKERVAVLRAPGIAATLLIATLSYTGLFTIYTFLAPLLAATAGVPAAQMSGMLLAFGFATVAGNALGGYAADRWGAVPAIAVSLLTAAPLLAALPAVATTPARAALLLFAWGVVHYLGLSPIQHRLATLAPSNPSVALALSGSAVYLGVAAGSAVGGAVASFAPIVALGAVGAAFKLAALVPLLASARARPTS